MATTSRESQSAESSKIATASQDLIHPLFKQENFSWIDITLTMLTPGQKIEWQKKLEEPDTLRSDVFYGRTEPALVLASHFMEICVTKLTNIHSATTI
jgi:hypothetical protein